MKKYISHILSVSLIIGFTFFTIENSFSQANGSKLDSSSVKAAPDNAPTYVKGFTANRNKSLVGVVAGLLSLVIGWRARVLSNKGFGRGRIGAIVALFLGLIGIILSTVHLRTFYEAALGTGSGKAGAFIALLLGLIGITLGGMTLRYRKAT